MKDPFYFTVTIPELGSGFTWIGGGLKPSERKGYVWLTAPQGQGVMEVLREQVRPTSAEELAMNIVAEQERNRAPLN
jgi:hypothetical protein